MTVLVLVIGAALGIPIGWRAAWAGARAQLRQELAKAQADMHREVNHWQEVAERATAEAARVARESEAYRAGRTDGREDVISIMPLLVAAQQRPAPEARASGGEGR